mgnify:CR=1 FL=1
MLWIPIHDVLNIHFFDMLAWIFGEVKTNITHLKEHDRASGFIEFERARVRWFLSINSKLLPEGVYFFVMEAEGIDGEFYSEKGTVTLIR